MNELADIEDNGSTYKPGDIKLKSIKNLFKMINMTFESLGTSADYHSERREWNRADPWQSLIQLSDDIYDEEGALTKAGHGFVDVNGQKLEAGKKIRVDNWAAFSQMGFDFSEQIMLNPEMSVVEGKRSLLNSGDADFSSDAEKATVPEKQTSSFILTTCTGWETTLALSDENITVDGKKLVFTLSESVPSGTFVEATYDPSLSFINDSSTEADNASPT